MYRVFVFLLIVNFHIVIGGEASENNHGMVTSAHSLASQVGLEVLQNGGNAIDAAVAVMFALPIVEPWASGLGGGGFLIVKMKNETDAVLIDYRERVPGEVNVKLFYRDSESFKYHAYTGYRSICVPGVVAGANVILKRFGTMDPAQILAPVIRLAKNGFPISFNFYKQITDYYDLIDLNRTTSELYYPNYLPVSEGDTLNRPDLASFYEQLADNGFQDFYNGEIATSIANDIQLNNGLITLSDLNLYNPKYRSVLRGSYHDYEVITTPPPSYGGGALIELLHVLQGYNLRKMGLNSGEYIHVFVEALKHVLKDRELYGGDPDFQPIRIEKFLTDVRAREIRNNIDSLAANYVDYHPAVSPFECENASHVSIIDGDGNVVSFTNSINFYFGSGVTHPEYGILFNNGLFNFSQDSTNLNVIAPNKRSASSMAPTLVLKDGKPFLILGSSGGPRTIAVLAQIIVAVIDFDLGIQKAIDLPRFFFEDGEVQMETRIESQNIEYLKNLGHEINLKTDYNTYFGIAQGIQIDESGQSYIGGADPRGEGTAVGY